MKGLPNDTYRKLHTYGNANDSEKCNAQIFPLTVDILSTYEVHTGPPIDRAYLSAEWRPMYST